jgi:hypothetical protein
LLRLTIALLLVLTISGLLAIADLLLVGVLVALVLLRRRVRRVAAAGIVRLVVLVLLGRAIALLLVCIVRRGLVCALGRSQSRLKFRMRRRGGRVRTCP